jgi:chondroitin AC lyase
MLIEQKISILLVIAIFCSSLSFAQQTNPYPKELVQMKTNLLNQFIQDTIDVSATQKLLDNLSAKGAWPNIDYSSKQRGRWPVIDHLENLQLLSKA